jgi:hypothetical protein
MPFRGTSDWGATVVRNWWRAAFGVGFVAMGIVMVSGGGAAVADTPVGTCTNSYAPYTFEQLSPMDSGLTPALFATLDTNGNGVICFKAYPNGPHNGHAGNLVDDKAAPHS